MLKFTVKNVLVLIAALALSVAAKAQSEEPKTMYVMYQGVVVCQQLVSEIDSIIFYEPDIPCPPDPEVGVIINGVRWSTRNLDVGGVFVTNSWDFGALYQWGRRADGHESRTSPTTGGPISTLDGAGQIPEGNDAYGKFVTNSTTPVDWRTPQDDALWNVGDENNPVKSLNDPCPCGWRLPTYAEIQLLVDAGHAAETLNGVEGRRFGSGSNSIFLPLAGSRNYGTGVVGNSQHYYWTSGVGYLFGTSYGQSLNVGTMPPGMYVSQYRAHGISIRCVAE